MLHISQSIPIDFLREEQVDAVYQLGKPCPAALAVTATKVYLKGDAIKGTLNILIAGDNTTAGVLSVEGANDIVPTIGIEPDFVPVGWAPILGASMSIAGNGTYLSPSFDVAYNFIQVKWTPSAGATGTIQGSILWQGRM